MAATNGMVAGIYDGWIAFRDVNGYAKGSLVVPDTVTANTTSSAYRIKYPMSISPAQITRERAIRRGAGKVRGSRQLGVSDLGTYTLETDGFDEQFDAYTKAYTVDSTTNTSYTMSAANSLLVTPPRFIMGLSIGLTGEDNVDYIDTYLWSNLTITKDSGEGSSQDGGTNPNPQSWTLTPDISTRAGYGQLLSGTALALVEDSDVFVRIRGQKQFHMTTYVANGSATSFILGFRPTSSDATGAAGNYIYKNGTLTAVTSVNTTTGVVTLAAAGSTGDIWIVLYPTNYTAI